MHVPRLGSSVIVRSSRLHSFGVTMAPAIITRVHSINVVDVTVFPPMGTPQVYSSLVFNEESTNAEGWHWPENEIHSPGFIPPDKLLPSGVKKDEHNRW